jgi:hypothetical protein
VKGALEARAAGDEEDAEHHAELQMAMASTRYIAVREAYEVLIDPARR